MVTPPRELAERCFALARSTTFEGERVNAIRRGEAICERHGLSLDLFDIPGRERAAPKMSGRRARFTVIDDPYGDASFRTIDTAEFQRVMREFQENMRSSTRSTTDAARAMKQAADDLAAKMADLGSVFVKGFERGSHDAAMKVRAAREKREARWPTVNAAVDFLFSRGIPVYDLGDAEDDPELRWFAPSHKTEPMTDDQVRELADTVEGIAA